MHSEFNAGVGQYAEISKSETDKSLDRFDKLKNGNGSNKTSELRLSMQKTMQSKCAVFRTEKTLKEGVNEIKKTLRRYAVHIS